MQQLVVSSSKGTDLTDALIVPRLCVSGGVLH